MNRELELFIEDAAKSVQAKPQGLVAGMPPFCDYWPTAKSVLEALKKYMPKLVIIITLLVAVGDKVCGSK